MHDSGDSAPRECGRISVVIARSEATKQSILPLCRALDCFASLAMTVVEATWLFEKLNRLSLGLSSPAKAGDPVITGVSDRTERPRRTGYPACAGYDG